MQKEHPPLERRTPSLLKRGSYVVAALGALTLVCLLALLLFPDPLVNRFVKPRITEAFAEAYPAYALHIGEMNYSVLKNRIGCDSIAVGAVDSTFSCTMGPLTVSGIGWMHLLGGGSLGPQDFADAAVDLHAIALNFPESQYALRCEMVRVSVPDSELVVETLSLHPSVDDEDFFAESTFRKTRFRLAVPSARMQGVACLDLLQAKSYRTRSARIQNMQLDALVNKDKPGASPTARPLMPNEVLSSIEGMVQVDSLILVNGRLQYGERFAPGSNPAVITFDSMEVLAEGIGKPGDSGAAVVIVAQGQFMKTGTMLVRMSIPAASPEFSYQYSGSLGRMDLRGLNVFLEEAEQMRIKTGALQSATFEIAVVSGRAGGTVRAMYKDLTVAAIDRQTGSEKGFGDGIASFIANTFKIRGTNMPDTAGATEAGEVAYARKRDDVFLAFTWFALRSGVADVVGF
jgi:hypothetical protein